MRSLLAACWVLCTQLQACDAALLCRCWLYLADTLGNVLTPLPEGFQKHIIWAFSTRAKQQDQVLCRLALFLDPRYRQAALSSSSNIMASFVQEAAKFGYLQGWDEEKINQLLSQLSNYSSYRAPFNLPASGLASAARRGGPLWARMLMVQCWLRWRACCWMWFHMQLAQSVCSVRWGGMKAPPAAG